MLPEDSMRFLKYVENTIYNEKGVSFSQLNNALKTINSYYKQAKDPNFKTHIKNAVENFLRDDIKRGIESIFAQNKTLYEDAQALFETALSDYAKMKDTLKLVDSLKVRDTRVSQAKAIKNILKYLDGQGSHGIAKENFLRLSENLPEELKAEFEVGFLQNILELSLKEIQGGKIFDSKEFFTRLEGMESFFTSPYAKEYIQIAKKFDTLFANDYKIAKSLSPSVSDKIGSSIATSIEGAVKFQVVKMMFENIIRLMPHIPFAKALNEKIQGAALRFHIKKALNNAIDVQDFKFSLQALEQKDFTLPTKEIIKRIKGEVDSLYKRVLEQSVATTPTQEPQLFTDLLDSHKPLRKAKQEELTDELLQKAIEQDSKLYIDDVAPHIAQALGMPSAKITMRGSAMAHALKRHGVDSNLVKKSGQEAIELQNLRTHNEIVNGADMQGIATDKHNQKVLISGKQVNGHCIVVESISTKDNELKFKTMYKEKGQLENTEAFKNIERLLTPPKGDASIRLAQRPDTNLDSSHLSSAYSTTKQNQSEVFPKRKELENSQFTDTKGEIDDTITRNSTDNANNSNISDTNTLDSQLHTTPQGNERVMGDISTQSRVHREGRLRESPQLQDITFKDTKGKEHALTEETKEQIPQDLQVAWIKEFNLQSIDDTFVPSFKPEVKEALEKAGITEDIKLTKGSLVKLVRENRFKYLDRIKPTLQEPDRIIKQDDITFIFAKDFGEEKYFTSVAKDDKGEWVITSNAPKSENGLNNKIAKGGEEIYNKQAGSQINASTPYDDVANSNTKLDKPNSTTTSQTPQTLTKQQAYHKIVGEYGKIFKKLPKVLADKDIDSILRDTKILADIRKRSFDERGFNPRLAELAAQDYFKKEKAITAFIYKAREYGLDLGFSSFTQFFKKRYGTQIKNDEQVKDMLASLNFFKSLKIDENPQRFTDIKMSEDKSGFNSYVERKINKYLGIDEMAKKLTHNPKFDELQAMLDLYYQAKRITKNPKDIQKVEQYANTLRPFFPSLVNKNTSDFLYEIDNLAYSAHTLLQSKVYIDLDSDFVYPQREAIEYFLDIKPLKEFGTNYAEYYRDGQRGIAKILAEAKDYEARKEAGKLTEAEIEQGAYKGQVAGAFYKEELGDIDLVWGDSHFGLQHILERRTQDFIKEGFSPDQAALKAREFVESLPQIVENGEVTFGKNRAFIDFDNKRSLIALDYKGEDRKWLITAYKEYDAPTPANPHQSERKPALQA